MKDHRERGAAVVETALVITLLFSLVIGATETAVLVLDQLAVGNATREGARVGALAGSESTADTLIVGVVEQALCSQDFGTATKLVIYEAGADGSVPGHNPAADPEYDNLAIANTVTYEANGTIACANGNTAPNFTYDVGNWSPANRNDTIAAGLDDLGVLIVYSHDDLTGFLPIFSGTSYTQRTVMRLEPDVQS
jgi:Flp pilus assembly protein TadG